MVAMDQFLSANDLLDEKHKYNIRWMTKRGFDVTNVNAVCTHRFETAMHAACRDGHLPRAKWLRAREASTSVEDGSENRSAA